MGPQEDFFKYLGATAGTLVAAFVLQSGLRSCIDVRYHEAKAEAPASAELVALRDREAAALKAANIQQAMAAVASNRSADTSIKPQPSDDLSAMSGWIQAPDNQPYEPEVVTLPAGGR